MRRSARLSSLPPGKASSRWITTAKNTAPSTADSVKTSGRSEKPATATSQANPVAAISEPSRLSGRRPQAYSPTPMNPQPAISAPAAHTPGVSSVSFVIISARTATPSSTPAAASAQRARRRLLIARSKEGLQGRPGELRLRDEAAHPVASGEEPEVFHVAAGGQHDRGRAAVLGQARGHLEAVDVGQLHVEQHHVRVEARHGVEGAQPVLRLADHVEALALEQHPGAGPEARVVVDDEDGGGHLS